jgi:hypothetical protein
MTVDEQIAMLHATIVMYHANNPDQRYGQAAYNCIDMLNPEFIPDIWTSNIDPFFNNGCVDDFLLYIAQRRLGVAPNPEPIIKDGMI